jgi:hypothetical protein
VRSGIYRLLFKSLQYSHPVSILNSTVTNHDSRAPKHHPLSPTHSSILHPHTLPNTHPQVGHELSALTPSRTLDSLYLTPILDTLSRQNPNTPFTTTPTKNGIYDTSASQTLYLFIDLKTPGPTTWPAVLSALAPLQNLGYLSTYDGNTFTSNPITVVGTGNTPLDLVQSAVPRFAFFDAPLTLLSTTFDNTTAFDSPIASTDFEASFGVVKGVGEGEGVLNDTQVDLLREQVGAAHDKGIKVRYWNLPAWPVGTRNSVWRTLWEEGVDFLNADDVQTVAGFWEGAG